MATEEEMPHSVELLLNVPQGFEPEAASEMAELTGVKAADIATYPGYGLLRLPVHGSLDALLDACCRSLSMIAAYAYLGSFEANGEQLADASLKPKSLRAASIHAGVRDEQHRLAWPAGMAMWAHIRQRAGKEQDPTTATFRANFEKYGLKLKDLITQELAGEVGSACIERWAAEHGGDAPKVNLTQFDLEVAGFMLRPAQAAQDVGLASSSGAPAATADADADGAIGSGAAPVPPLPPSAARGRGNPPQQATAGPLMVLLGLGLPLPLIAPPGSPGAHLGTARNRVAAGRTGLRPATAYVLARFAGIQPGEVVLDMCCGVATIPIEAARAFPRAFYLGGDNAADQLCEGGLANARHALLQPASSGDARVDGAGAGAGAGGRVRMRWGAHKLDLLVWNACDLPLRPGTIDLFITDLPWGLRENRKGAGKRQRDQLYPALLEQMKTLLAPRPSSRAVFVSGATKQFQEAMARAGRGLNITQQREIVIGGTHVQAYLVRRSSAASA